MTNNLKLFKENISAVFDSKGNLYEIPNYCINEPYKFIESSFDEKSIEEKNIEVIIRHGTDDYKIHIPNTIKVMNLKQALIKKIKNKGSIKSIRLFYLGKELKDNKKMNKVKNNCIIQALLILNNTEENYNENENVKEKIKNTGQNEKNVDRDSSKITGETYKVIEKIKSENEISNNAKTDQEIEKNKENVIVNKKSSKVIPKYKNIKKNSAKCNLNDQFQNCDKQDDYLGETFKDDNLVTVKNKIDSELLISQKKIEENCQTIEKESELEIYNKSHVQNIENEKNSNLSNLKIDKEIEIEKENKKEILENNEMCNSNMNLNSDIVETYRNENETNILK